MQVSDDGAGSAVSPVIPHGTGLVYDVAMMQHATPAADVHPEQPDRITRIFGALEQAGCVQRMVRIPAREALRSEVELVHEPQMWDQFEALVRMPPDELRDYSADLEVRASLYLNAYSTVCARLACGSVIDMCAAVTKGRVRNGLAVVRPPGHHAEPGCGTGFCLYNNVSVATRCMLREGSASRVLILDWDVHHGNGTQRAFWDDPNVLYISLHRYDEGTFYPGGTFGNYDQVGGDAARGMSVNVPWPCGGMDDADYLHAFHQCILPIAYEFAPDLVIISAGFDAAAGDLLGGCHVSPAGYAHMAYHLSALAGGRLVVALEGGYTLDAIASSALAVARVLLGEPLPRLARAVCSPIAAETVQRVVRAQAPFWESLAAARELAPAPASSDGLVPLLDVVLEARAARLWEQHQLMPVPHGDGAAELVPNQALVSANALLPETETLVFFVHDRGPLLVGCSDPATGEPPVYAESAIEAVLAWSAARHYATCDLSTLQSIQLQCLRNHQHDRIDARAPAIAARTRLQTQVLFLWDHVVSLAPARRIVMVGFGTACDALVHLASERVLADRVCAILQVPGQHPIPLVPKQRPELKRWYAEHSLVLCPHNHPRFAWNEQEAAGKRLGTVVRAPEASPLDVLVGGLARLDELIARPNSASV